MRSLAKISSFLLVLFLTMNTQAQILDDFETTNNWNPSVNAEWTASSTTPIAGAKSLKHEGNGTTSGSTKFSNVSRAMPAILSNLTGSTTTWEFKIKTSGKGVSASQKFWIVLAANGSNTRMPNTSNVVDISVPSVNGINGYAIGVNPLSSTATARPLKLMRLNNSAQTDLVNVNGSLYSGNYGTSTAGYNVVGIKVVRTPSAAWTVYADFNNDGTYEVVTSPVTDNNFNNMSFVGASLRWPTTATASTTLAGNMFIDNFSVSQTATPVTYYSIANGNMNGPGVWSLSAGGPAVTPSFNYASSLIIAHNISIDGSYALSNVTLNAGGTLTAASAAQTLTITGNWINNNNSAAFNGNFDNTCCTSGCRVTMGGTNAQTIGGSAGTRFMELQINNAAGVTLIAPVYVTAAVIPTLGTLTTNGTGGSLALLSSINCSGSIAAISSSSDVSGPITLQRYIPALDRASWNFLSCPLYANAALTAGLTPTAAWSGATLNGVTYPALTMNTSSIKWYDETMSGVSNFGFTVINPTTGTINPRWGLNVYSAASALTLNPTGYISKGNINIPMTYTALGAPESWGRNLMANPYPSEINWDLVEAASSDVGAYYVYDYETNNYLYYNPNDGLFNTTTAYPNGIGKYIPHSQSFFVICNATNQSLNFTENMKTNRCTPKSFERATALPAVALHLLDNQQQVKDASNISHHLNSTMGINPGWDVIDMYDLENNPFNLSLLSEEKVMLMASSISLEEKNSIPVYLDLHNDMDAFDYALVKISTVSENGNWFIQNQIANEPITVLSGSQNQWVAPQQWIAVKEGDIIRIPYRGDFHSTAFIMQNCVNNDCPQNEDSSPSPFKITTRQSNHSIQFFANGQTMTQYWIYNPAGQLVEMNNALSTNIEISTVQLVPGIYTIKIADDSGAMDVTRFIVK